MHHHPRQIGHSGPFQEDRRPEGLRATASTNARPRLDEAGLKVRRRKGGTYPLSHLYGYFGLVRLTALGYDVPWVKA